MRILLDDVQKRGLPRHLPSGLPGRNGGLRDSGHLSELGLRYTKIFSDGGNIVAHVDVFGVLAFLYRFHGFSVSNEMTGTFPGALFTC